MKTYKLQDIMPGYGTEPTGVQRLNDMSSIPFDLANTDYVNFKKEVNEGAELQDAEGNVLPEAKEFIKTLP
jgi:hypothetical protein